MTLTPAEKQRRYRERKKMQRKANLGLPGPADRSVFRKPFHEFFDDDYRNMEASFVLALAGMEMPYLQDDSGPEAHVIGGAGSNFEEPLSSETGAIGRMDVIIGSLIEAAVVLADALSAYKKSEIADRIKEIENSDFDDPDGKAHALKEIVRLNTMLEQLDKQVRWTFPQWKTEG